MRLKMLVDIGGPFEGIENGVERGQIVTIDNEDRCKNYIFRGYATAKLDGEMPTAYPTEESESYRDEVEAKARERLRGIRIQSGQLQQEVIGSRYQHQFAREGWVCDESTHLADDRWQRRCDEPQRC
jgi:hypothetical protein